MVISECLARSIVNSNAQYSFDSDTLAKINQNLLLADLIAANNIAALFELKKQTGKVIKAYFA